MPPPPQAIAAKVRAFNADPNQGLCHEIQPLSLSQTVAVKADVLTANQNQKLLTSSYPAVPPLTPGNSCLGPRSDGRPEPATADAVALYFCSQATAAMARALTADPNQQLLTP